jgi:MFS family permease
VHVDPRARTEILIAILLAMFLSALDQTIVGTALPTIMTQLHGNNLYTCVVTIYLLTATISGPIYGKLSDQFGRRPMVMIGVSLFLVGSALSGLAGGVAADRGPRPAGPWSRRHLPDRPRGHRRPLHARRAGKYQGLFGAVFGISALIGPALGGFLTDNVSWHWIFFVNLPIGAVALRHHLAAAAPDQASRAGAEHRLPRQRGLHRRPGPDPHRPDQQQTMDWTNPRWAGWSSSVWSFRSSSGSSPAQRSRSCR